MIGVAGVSLTVLLAALVPSPFSIERPGPVVDTLSQVSVAGDSTEVIHIEGAKTYDTSGSLNLLTVSIVGSPERPASWLSLIPALIDPSQRIAPTEEFYPQGVTQQDRNERNIALMDTSQERAAAAAFRALGQDVRVTLTVAGVSEDGPASGKLREGDTLVAVNGVPIQGYASLQDAIAEAGLAGKPVRIGITRDGVDSEVEMTPVVTQEGAPPLIGILIQTQYELPAQVDIAVSDIGGPSAGMIFALAIYDKLTPEPLLNGMVVSGTGTITDTGVVGPIGGLDQKMWAAARAKSDLFLMSLDNCAELPEQIPGELRVAPVATLAEAIETIRVAAAGGEVAGVERCSAK